MAQEPVKVLYLIAHGTTQKKGNCNPDREGGSAGGAASSGGIKIIHDKWKGSVKRFTTIVYVPSGQV